MVMSGGVNDDLKIADYDVDTLMDLLRSVWQGKRPSGSVYDIKGVKEIREAEIIVDVIVSAPQYGKVLGGPLLMIGLATFKIDGEDITPTLKLAYRAD